MRQGGEPGLIVNTGSKQGITMPPGNLGKSPCLHRVPRPRTVYQHQLPSLLVLISVYNVSKAALKTFTEGLEHELRQEKDGNLSAALLVPVPPLSSFLALHMDPNRTQSYCPCLHRAG